MTISTEKNKLELWISLTLVAVLSLWIRIEYFHNTDVDIPIRGDAASYVQYAFNMINHHTYSKSRATGTPQPDAYWAPGYPSLIFAAMLLEKTFGADTYRTIIYSQAIMGSLIAVFTLLLGRLFLYRYWALFAALLVVFSPHLISLGNYVLTETLFTLLLLIAIYSFVLAFQARNRKLFTLAGLLFGLTYLINPVSYFTPILFAGLAMILYKYRLQQSLKTSTALIAPCLIVFFIIIGAWATRTAVSVPADSPSSSTRLLTNLVIGAHHDWHAIWRANPRDPNNPATVDSRNIDGSYSAFIDLLLDRISQDPIHYAKWYLIQKPVRLWDWDILTGQGDIYVYPVNFSLYHVSKPAIFTYSIMRATHYWLFGFAVLGLYFACKQSKAKDSNCTPLFLYLSVVYISAVYVISQAEARYSIPLRPQMYLCAAYFLSQITAYIGKKNY